ncbi:Enzymatic polyprotein [Sesamum angolense]|uniref:Enzymatic polyprotein n=1 Tax=Sesamum angolense TaxID=2727404 RepID=A0AAE1W0G0_9LAMI|nr:Enzymatic polyprotein [Sesamum angolense]
MDLQPSQNNHSDEDRLQTSESLSEFFSKMTVSNKTMERIMRQDSNLSPYDGFRIGGIGLVLSENKATIAVNKIEFLGILIDEAGIELQEHIVEKIRNFPDVLKDKKQLQSFLGVVNFAGIFIKDLAKYRKDFRPLLKETESAKWKWEEIHTQRVRELK